MEYEDIPILVGIILFSNFAWQGLLIGGWFGYSGFIFGGIIVVLGIRLLLKRIIPSVMKCINYLRNIKKK